MKLRKLSVTEVNTYAQKLLSYDPILQNINVEGEISNFVAHSSGHAYFSLKDNDSKINCIMFSRYFSLLKDDFKNGDKVDCLGDISIFVRDGKFQLYVKEMKNAGLGELHIKFEQLKKRYKELNYFDQSHKKEIPKYPKKIGVITSATGAAIKDIISVFNRRTTLADLMVYSVSVQGIYSKDEIVKAINFFNDKENVDLIIISRGGGSIEELWSFNEPEVVETVFDSEIPIISGIGHETDYTLVDFVSDLRAPTPSSAAEVALKSNKEIVSELENYKYIMNREITSKVANYRNQLERLSFDKLLIRKRNVIKEKFYLLDNINFKINTLINDKIKKEKNYIEKLLIQLNNNNPIEIMKKGYSITKDEKGSVISSIKNINELEVIKTMFLDGEV
ncbi:MAG: exodeoxyribonuclease VII large subunit, partial [Bacillota bacterium]|nr:exodeoxyribonuclease VII large subunit [Bacillota bacterium]